MINIKKKGRIILIILIITVVIILIILVIKPFIHRDILYATDKDIRMLESGIIMFYTTNLRYPTRAEGLDVVLPFIDVNEIPLDPWGNPYYYLIPGPNNIDFGIISFGEDGIPGGKKDFYSWQ